MTKENQNLFPEKDLIDMKFLVDLLKYGTVELSSKEDVDKALQELSLLRKKKAEVSDISDKLCKEISGKADSINDTLEYAMGGIRDNIKKYYDSHFTDFKFEDCGEISKAAIKFEHGEIICINTMKTEIKTSQAQTAKLNQINIQNGIRFRINIFFKTPKIKGENKMHHGNNFPVDPRSPHELNKLLGPTGKFPGGKLNINDEGEILCSVGVTNDKVIVNFGDKPISWIGFSKEQALKIAESLTKFANKIT